MSEDFKDAETIREISGVVERFGTEALDGKTSDAAARAWVAAGFDDPEDVSDWLHARCFSAAAAQTLDTAGITPEQASLRTSGGTGDYEETLAYKFTHGDLSIGEVRRIVTNEFWNT